MTAATTAKQLSECLNIIASARRLFPDDLDGSLEKADKAMEHFLNMQCRRSGANPSTVITRGGAIVPFDQWGVTQYIQYLVTNSKLSKASKAAFFKVHEIRNSPRHHNSPLEPRIVERCLSVVEYAIRSESENQSPNKRASNDGGRLKIPTRPTRTISKSKQKLWFQRGWYAREELRKNLVITRERYLKWEQFEIKLRLFLKSLGFQNTIDDTEDFWYKELGPQVDACGGADGVFFVIDCTSKAEEGMRSLTGKIRNVAGTRNEISKNVDRLYPGMYHTKVFILCTEDIDISGTDRDAARRADVRLLDSETVDSWFKYYQTLGVALRGHIIRSVSGFRPVLVDNESDPFFHFPAFRTISDSQVLYHFLADPERLLKIAYVYRLELDDPEGYQRALSRRKTLSINNFLTEKGTYFANNLVFSLDGLLNDDRWPDFDPRAGGKGFDFGILHLPKIACSAEVIDGQHRLYGYLDASDSQKARRNLRLRRKDDRLNVVAVVDPAEDQRARLFLDINSNQTKVNIRQQWMLMARVRPSTLMGYIGKVVISLNSTSVFKNKIFVPGRTRASKKMNIANLSKGLMDRKLLTKEQGTEWNLYSGSRRSPEYSQQEIKGPVHEIARYFRLFEGDAGLSKFAFTNNGFNVLLRVMVQWLKFKPRGARSKALLNHAVQDATRTVLSRGRLNDILRRTSNEGERAALAEEIMASVRKKKGLNGFAAEILV